MQTRIQTVSKQSHAGRRVPSLMLACVLGAASACGGAEERAAEEGPKGPVLGVLELPVSLRATDAAPSGAAKIECSLTELRANDATVLALENGKVSSAERAGDVIEKLKGALSGKTSATVAVHSGLPYETLALILRTAAQTGVREVAFQVRKAGASTESGYMLVKGLITTPRSDEGVAIPSVDPRTWDEMAAAWQAIYDACRTSQTGSCAYVPTNVYKGGQLKIVLHASGQGVNVNFFRVGLSPEQLAAEEQTRQSELAKKKEDFLQGRTDKTDLEAALEDGAPVGEAMFQFRSQDALSAPSAVTGTMQPLCGTRACGAVVSADPQTLSVRVLSLIGAAYADGAAPPVLAFEEPWTEKPKPVVPVAAPAAPAAPPEPKQ